MGIERPAGERPGLVLLGEAGRGKPKKYSPKNFLLFQE